MNTCPLCQRPFGEVISDHHLIPRSLKGKAKGKVALHLICHDKIHSVFTERELANDYNTIERILENQHIKAFVKWVASKDPDFFETTKDQATRKRRRRR